MRTTIRLFQIFVVVVTASKPEAATEAEVDDIVRIRFLLCRTSGLVMSTCIEPIRF
jgi:hypothetical protein